MDDDLIEEALRRLQHDNQRLKADIENKNSVLADARSTVQQLATEVGTQLEYLKFTGSTNENINKAPSISEMADNTSKSDDLAVTDVSFDELLDNDVSELDAGTALAAEPGLRTLEMDSFFKNTAIVSGLVEKFKKGFDPTQLLKTNYRGAGFFTGQEVADWLVTSALITRLRALGLGQYMIEHSIIESVDKNGKARQNIKFRDDRTLYRFKNEDSEYMFLLLEDQHEFVQKDMKHPVICDHCGSLCWVGTMAKCKICKFRCHKACELLVTAVCSRTEEGNKLTPASKRSITSGSGAAGSLISNDSVDSNGADNDLEDDSGALEERDVNPMIIPPSAVKLINEKADGTNGQNKFSIALPPDCMPVVVFINRKSGGQEGGRLLDILSGRLHDCQIWDLSQGGPRPGLEQFKDIPNHKVMVCGGDGTVGWVLSEMDKVDYGNLLQPPVSVLPLGTGNDLSRVLGWGAGGGARSLSYVLKKMYQVLHSEVIMLDRWSVAIHESTSQKHLVVMNNYFSLGVDAKIALNFHKSRENSPQLYKSKNINKFWYVTFAAKAMFTHHSTNLNEKVTLEIDGVHVAIPKELEGIMVLNISSYAAGTDLWGKKKEEGYVDQSFSDNLIEVVGVTGVSHLGRIQAKLSSGRRLGQGRVVKFTISQQLCAQVDGEPWLQDPAVIVIKLLNQARMLRLNKKERFHPDFVSVNVTPQELEVISADFLAGVPTYQRKILHHLVKRTVVFIGTEAVDWLMYYMKTDDRSKAWKVGQMLMDSGLFVHVGRRKHFRDQNVYYRFAEGKGTTRLIHTSSIDSASENGSLSTVSSLSSSSTTSSQQSKNKSSVSSVLSGRGSQSSLASPSTAPILASVAATAALSGHSSTTTMGSGTPISSISSAIVSVLSSDEVNAMLRLAHQMTSGGATTSGSSRVPLITDPNAPEQARRNSLICVSDEFPEFRSKLELNYISRVYASGAAGAISAASLSSASTGGTDEIHTENFMAHLKVFIIEAKDVRPLDTSCDPYLICECENEVFKSSVIRRTLKPVFGEEFHFIISHSNAMINFTVYDHNRSAKMMSLDEAFLGRLRLPISSIEVGTVDKWYQLLPKKDKNVGLRPKGSIRLIIEYTPLLGTVDTGISLGPEPFLPPGEPSGGFKGVISKISEANHACCAFNNVYQPLMSFEDMRNPTDFELVSAVALAEAKFEYFNAPMKNEKIEAYVQRDERISSDSWTRIGDFTTDGEGRISVPMPNWVHSTVAHYRIRMVALHDHSIAAGSLFILNKGSGCVVYDIDGTLTVGDQEVVQAAMKDAVNVSHDLKLRKGAVSLVRMWYVKGYLPIYLSGRAGSFYNLTRDWLIRHGFPPGPIHHTKTHVPTLPLYPSVGVFKRDYVSHLQAIGLNVYACYGNTQTDVRAYGECGIPKDRTFIVGPHAGYGGTVNAGISNFKDHLLDVVNFPEATVPIPRESMDW